MDKMALSKEWENRNVVKVARVKKGTEVTHAIGTVKAQTRFKLDYRSKKYKGIGV